MTSIEHIGVIGAGAWGMALAQVAASAGRKVTLWARDPALAAEISDRRTNAAYLPGVSVHAAVRATTSLEAVAGADILLAAAPAQHTRAVLRALAPHLSANAAVALCSKGVERETLALMSEVLASEMPQARALALSGPGFAQHVARGLPTATTIACADEALARALAAAIGLSTFRPYVTTDVIGAEVGGAVKNVIAIACGVAEGRSLGDGARAALITRGFAELTRLGRAMGARAETLNGLCGLGDLVLTCTSMTSRNTSLGAELGRGRRMAEVLGERRTVAEGAASAAAVVALAARHGVEMPICAAVADVVAERTTIDGAIEALLSRPFRGEGI